MLQPAAVRESLTHRCWPHRLAAAQRRRRATPIRPGMQRYLTASGPPSTLAHPPIPNCSITPAPSSFQGCRKPSSWVRGCVSPQRPAHQRHYRHHHHQLMARLQRLAHHRRLPCPQQRPPPALCRRPTTAAAHLSTPHMMPPWHRALSLPRPPCGRKAATPTAACCSRRSVRWCGRLGSRCQGSSWEHACHAWPAAPSERSSFRPVPPANSSASIPIHATRTAAVSGYLWIGCWRILCRRLRGYPEVRSAVRMRSPL